MIVKLFLFWRIGLFWFTFLGSMVLPLAANTSPGAIALGKSFDYWLSWAQWDGGNYLEIAANGYYNSQSFAFAPLFPFAAKAASLLFFGNIFWAGLLVSNAAFLAFLLLFYKYLTDNYQKNVANSTLITFLLFPTAFFGVAFYSESLFLLFTIIALIYISEKKFTRSALVIALASITRFIGIFLVISLYFDYFRSIN